MIIVSSCLAGIECRYNGTHSLRKEIQQLVERNKAVIVCPELLGGFATPREPAEIVGDTGEDVLNGKSKIIERSGSDVTELYLKGAYKTLEMATDLKADMIVLKEYSPSCGSRMVHDGSFSNQRIPGEGVTAALLRRHGFTVLSETEFEEMLQNKDL
ncbi:DUF523 domain-containing protein [Paenibacillus profundus]|uniref:DUF523 domain-containing protein n=1 Tax=Paenibacillus profundus TaxID=1173085 RepID=A0ABS8YS31_9BACL|nr:DUF523 domain-containing protein [Paenibacillus profundus]MCE5173092.1 DUF523 domain-containing protein [Paenibacillus profundus]